MANFVGKFLTSTFESFRNIFRDINNSSKSIVSFRIYYIRVFQQTIDEKLVNDKGKKGGREREFIGRNN